VYEEAITYCGNRDPRTPLAAQFSLSFGIACMLRFGHLDPAAYDEPHFSDPELRRLEKLVRIQPDRELTAKRQRGARLAITAERMLESRTLDTDPALVLDEQGVIDKFVRNAAHFADPSRARSFCSALLDATEGAPLANLWGKL
jgi:2-methylcitrate dehydratase PrpD